MVVRILHVVKVHVTLELGNIENNQNNQTNRLDSLKAL